MDNLTHSLVGLALSRCGLGPYAQARGEKRTALMMVLAANAPDIDTYPFFTDTVEYLSIHRGYTHALALAPLLALLPLAIVKGATRTRPTLWSWFACTVAVLSHLALDWTNVYGVRMLLPLSDRWIHLDITDIVDPLIWLLLMICLGVPSILGLVSSEIGSRKSNGGKFAWAWIALLGLFAYEGVRWTSHERAIASLNSYNYMGAPAKKVWAFPSGFVTLRWRGLVEGDGFYYEIPVSGSGAFEMQDAKLAYKAAESPARDAAMTTRTFQVFEKFNQVPLWEISPIDDETRVDLYDLRFGTLERHGFTATAIVEPDGRIQDVRFGFGR